MEKDQILKIAKRFLKESNINFAEPIKFGRLNGDIQEVIFTHPLSLDPNVASMDPDKIKVLVNINSKEASLKYEM